MCGIAGIIGRKNDFRFGANDLLRMSSELKHRGPDDGGFLVSCDYINYATYGTIQTPDAVYQSQLNYCPNQQLDATSEGFNFALLHQRLAIVDLSEAGHQPMFFNDCWITFNGEIYNYIELREELIQKGYTFFTQTDTEVVLKAYDCWGESFLNKLNGMWSFMIFNEKTKSYFASRDRIGVKPFYFIDDTSFFAFASEIKALHFLSFVHTKINQKHLFSYFANHEVEFDGHTLFDPIQELKPGHVLKFNSTNQKICIAPYFEINIGNEKSTENIAHIIDETEELLKEAVSIRLRSDVPIGFCLSGGIDSSSLVSIAAKTFELNNLKSFSALTADKNTDEKIWIDKVLDEYEIDAHFVQCNSDDLIANLEEIIYYQDIPILTASTFAQDSVMKLAKQNGVSVLIDGQGGDELFAGYIPFYTSQLNFLLKTFRWFKVFKFLKNLKNSPYSRGEVLKTYGKTLLNKYIPKRILAKSLTNKRIDLQYFNTDVFNHFQENIDFGRGYFLDEPNLVMKKFYQGNFLKNLLRWEDRCSMHYSIESRTPFSDDLPMMEYLFSLPFELKIKEGVSKYLLRNAMSGILPDAIKTRNDKKGFSIPQSIWFTEKTAFFKNIVEQYRDPINFINKNKVLEEWDVKLSDEKYQQFIFKYVCYLLWAKRFNMNS